jgi:hypothetical protein
VLLASRLAAVVLGGCSLLTEDLRRTYDESKVVPGATREAVETELGSPVRAQVAPNPAGAAIYRTSRVTKTTVSALKATRMGLDLFTFGLGEFMAPFGSAENESKVFHINYDEQGRAKEIFVSCESGQHKSLQPVPAGGLSLTCSQLLKG